MGPILAILSYVTKTFSNLLLVKNKATNSNYDPDKHSNEAIGNDTDTIIDFSTMIYNNTNADLFNTNLIRGKLPTTRNIGDATYDNQQTILSNQTTIIDDLRGGVTDSTANAYMREVVGNKADTPQTTVTNTRSIMAYVKGILSYLSFPTQDSTNNTTVADVVGNKADSEATNVANTTSAIAYLKGLIQELDQRKVPKMVRVAIYWKLGEWYDVVNITDKGVLTCVSQQIYSSSSYNSTELKIVIDGISVYEGAFAQFENFINNNYYGQYTMNFQHRFNSSLLVQHKSYTPDINTFVTYTVDD